MARKLATLEVWYNDSETPMKDPSGEEIKSTGLAEVSEGKFMLALQPKLDVQVQAINEKHTNVKTPDLTKELPSILAHELGHFVANINHEIEQSAAYYQALGPVDAEQAAWRYAQAIYPGLNPSVEAAAMAGYQLNENMLIMKLSARFNIPPSEVRSELARIKERKKELYPRGI